MEEHDITAAHSTSYSQIQSLRPCLWCLPSFSLLFWAETASSPLPAAHRTGCKLNRCRSRPNELPEEKRHETFISSVAQYTMSPECFSAVLMKESQMSENKHSRAGILPCSCCRCNSTIFHWGFWHKSHSGPLPLFPNDTETKQNKKNCFRDT